MGFTSFFDGIGHNFSICAKNEAKIEPFFLFLILNEANVQNLKEPLKFYLNSQTSFSQYFHCHILNTNCLYKLVSKIWKSPEENNICAEIPLAINHVLFTFSIKKHYLRPVSRELNETPMTILWY